MYSKETEIVNETGLHARPASEFVNQAKKFASKITIAEVGGDPANAKSIVTLLALGLAKGKKIVISAEGEDEQAAVDTLIGLIDSGFGE